MDGLGKHILAAYYNEARLNILASLNHIRATLNLPDKDNEALILNAYQELRLLERKREPELQADIIKKLRNHFRFLDPLTDQRTDTKIKREALSKHNNNDKALESDTATPELYEEKMLWMLRQVDRFRNAFVHPTLIDNSEIEELLHKCIYHDLYGIYDSALTTVKERFSLEEYLVKPLRSQAPVQQKV